MPAPDYASEIGSLEAAIATGELRVEQNGELVHYQTVGDQLKALAYFRSQASAAANPNSRQAAFGFSAPPFCRD